MIATLLAAAIGSTPYLDCYSQAVREGKPMVVFVGVPAMPGPWIASERASFPDVEKGVILSIPCHDTLEWVDTLPWYSDAEVIVRRLREARQQKIVVHPPIVIQRAAPPLRFVPMVSPPMFRSFGSASC